MSGPITRELIQQHPALQRFVEYVEFHSGAAVDPSQIAVTTHREAIPGDSNNNISHDGILEFNYATSCRVGQSCPVFYGRLDANAQAISLRHGFVTPQLQNGQYSFPDHYSIDLLPTPIVGACATLHAIGGEQETSTQCSDWDHLTWVGLRSLGHYTGLEILGTFASRVAPWGKFPLFNFLRTGLQPVGTQSISTLSRLRQTTPGLIAGGAAMFGVQAISEPLLGLDPQLHNNERFGLSALAAHGANRGIHHLLTRRAPAGTVRIRPSSLGAGLISSALVDSLFGPAVGESGSTSREALRGSAFFIPQIYRGIMGNRTLAMASRPRLAAAGRWASRGVVAAWASDLIYSGYRYIDAGSTGSAREHNLYRRAQELQSAREGDSFLTDAFSAIAPTLGERLFTGNNYLSEARSEFQDNANSVANTAGETIRYNLIHGNAGQNQDIEFYRDVDLSWLRNDNTLGRIHKSGRSSWSLNLVAEDLGDERLYRTHLAGRNADQQIAWIQNQYSGWRLSPNDVQEILARISLHHAREDIANLHHMVGPSDNAMTRLFDESGRLASSQDQALINQVFTGQAQTPSTEQVLSLRKIGLLVRIRQLRANLQEAQGLIQTTTNRNLVQQSERDLGQYTQIALDLGLMDTEGTFATGEISDQANRIQIAQAQEIQQRGSNYTGADLLRSVYHMNASGEFRGLE